MAICLVRDHRDKKHRGSYDIGSCRKLPGKYWQFLWEIQLAHRSAFLSSLGQSYPGRFPWREIMEITEIRQIRQLYKASSSHIAQAIKSASSLHTLVCPLHTSRTTFPRTTCQRNGCKTPRHLSRLQYDIPNKPWHQNVSGWISHFVRISINWFLRRENVRI